MCVPPPPHPAHKATEAKTHANSKRERSRVAFATPRRASINKKTSGATRSAAAGNLGEAGQRRGAIVEAVVVTVVVAVAAPDPLGVTEDGEMVQLASDGAPLQLRATAWLNPPTDVTVRV